MMLQKPSGVGPPPIPKEVINVVSVNFDIERNARAHHTSDYKITQPSEKENQRLVVRRGQPFNIEIVFDRKCYPEYDDVQVEFVHSDYAEIAASNDHGGLGYPALVPMKVFARLDLYDEQCFSREDKERGTAILNREERYTNDKIHWLSINNSEGIDDNHPRCWRLTYSKLKSKVPPTFAPWWFNQGAMYKPEAYALPYSKNRHFEIRTPVNLVIGEWKMVIRKRLRLGLFDRSETHHTFYVLFNPWCKDDAVCMQRFGDDMYRNMFKEDALANGGGGATQNMKPFRCDYSGKEEYVLKADDRIFIGNKHQIETRHWIYGQFQKNVFHYALRLLPDKDDEDFNESDDAESIAQKVMDFLSDFIYFDFLDGDEKEGYEGTQDQYDRLLTNIPGTLTWINADNKADEDETLLRAYDYILAPVATAIMRSLGIPSRCVTSYDHAHDTRGKMDFTMDWNHEGILTHQWHGKRWIFHVWNEVFLKVQYDYSKKVIVHRAHYKGGMRLHIHGLQADEDMKLGDETGHQFNGWQAGDMVESFSSIGRSPGDFAPVSGIKQIGELENSVQVRRFRRKVNKPFCHRFTSDLGTLHALVEPNRCACSIITSTPRAWKYDPDPARNKVPQMLVDVGVVTEKNENRIWNLTSYYKEAVEPEKWYEVAQVMSRPWLRQKWKCSFDVRVIGSLMIGQPLRFELTLRNSSNEPADITTAASVQTVNVYNCNPVVVGYIEDEVDVPGSPGSHRQLILTYNQYASALQHHNYLQVSFLGMEHSAEQCMFFVREYQLTKPKLHVDLKDRNGRNLEPQNIDLEGHSRPWRVPATVRHKEEVSVHVQFTNPLPVALTNWILQAEYTGNIGDTVTVRGNELASIAARTVPAGANFNQYFRLIIPPSPGLRFCSIVVTFDSTQLRGLNGSTDFNVIPAALGPNPDPYEDDEDKRKFYRQWLRPVVQMPNDDGRGDDPILSQGLVDEAEDHLDVSNLTLGVAVSASGTCPPVPVDLPPFMAGLEISAN